jgi:hypothetical protein
VSNDRQSLILRAQEIITSNPDGMTARMAYKSALLERFKGDPEALAEHAASLAAGTLAGLRKRTYDLPDTEIGALFNIPQVIGIRTEDGDLLVSRDHADTDQVQQWAREGDQYHSTQRLRFRRFREQLEPLKELEKPIPWWEGKSRLLQIEQGPADDGQE